MRWLKIVAQILGVIVVSAIITLTVELLIVNRSCFLEGEMYEIYLSENQLFFEWRYGALTFFILVVAGFLTLAIKWVRR